MELPWIEILFIVGVYSLGVTFLAIFLVREFVKRKYSLPEAIEVEAQETWLSFVCDGCGEVLEVEAPLDFGQTLWLECPGCLVYWFVTVPPISITQGDKRDLFALEKAAAGDGS